LIGILDAAASIYTRRVDAAQRKRLEETTRYEPSEVEGRVFAEWIEGGYFHPEPEGAPGENFSVAIPPPNVTGALHMGHALNGSIQDALVRLNRMRGRNTLWVLGADHAGIATQAVVEKELRAEGRRRQELGREEFVKRVWEWKEEYGSRIVAQYKRLGASCDYERERFTLDEGYVRAVYRVFKRLYDKGYIYRDHYMVNWDPGSRSAISDLEVENREVEDRLFSIDYPVEDSDRVLTVATVRPETMLGDTAVAVNPSDERYADLVGRHCLLPLVGRRLPIIADEHVDPEFGTGALKITPGHDPNDFEIGRRHGLAEIVVIGPDGRLTEEAGRFAGMTATEAQEAVAAALREEGRLRREEPYVHSAPFSHRSGERIEPLISLQWFCRMNELARPAIEVVERDEVRIVPARWKRVYLDWMEEIRPWCISRQLWWGHRIPVWYCDACEETIVAERPPERCGACDGELRQEEDVLDTWFSSALWPFATLGWPDDAPELRAFYPTSFLTTAREILFLWVARMVMMGIEFPGDVPFREVYVHSVIQARDGRRMSKSLGTGIDPLEEIDVHGADALRFGLLAMSSTQDVRFSDAKVQQGRDLANKLWNAGRLILLNCESRRDQSPIKASRGQVPAAVGDGMIPPRPEPIRVEDRWILSRLERTIASVTAKLEAYDFAHAVQEAYSFFWRDLCDWYLEIVKPRLYDGEEEVSATLLWALERVLALLHPTMPFVTEEVWSFHPSRRGHLVVHPFPEADESLFDAAAEADVEAGIALTQRLRAWRDLAGVSAGAMLTAVVDGVEPPEFVARLSRFRLDSAPARLRSGREEPGTDASSASPYDGVEPVAAVGPVRVLASGDLDAAAVAARLKKRRAELRAEVERAERKLGNEGFTAKAPAEVVEEERGKLERYRAELAELE
jgi:valyl-tRNA synthetase